MTLEYKEYSKEAGIKYNDWDKADFIREHITSYKSIISMIQEKGLLFINLQK
jgi:replicative DNA helicase